MEKNLFKFFCKMFYYVGVQKSAKAELCARANKEDDIVFAAELVNRLSYMKSIKYGFVFTPHYIVRSIAKDCGTRVARMIAQQMYPNGYDVFFERTMRGFDQNPNSLDLNKINNNITKSNPFNGGLNSNRGIVCVKGTDLFIGGISTTDKLKSKVGYRQLDLINFDFNHKVKGNEFVAEITAVAINGTEVPAVVRTVWDTDLNQYVGLVFEKYEHKCRINWNQWKKDHNYNINVI